MQKGGAYMKDFAAGIVSKKGQYVVCGKAKRNSDKHVKLVKRVSDVSSLWPSGCWKSSSSCR